MYDDSVKPYNRKQHFGGWVRDPKDSSCQNTRAKVLIRDSLEPVTFHPGTCRVAQGDWKDPYGGEDFFDAQQIQIDHMVPLKNAYISGAWSWDFNKRCLYGNFLGNKFHLIAVSGHENQSKSDKTPEFYLPKVSVYQCEYIENWLKIKLIWQLKLSESEALAIQNLAQKLSCPKEDFYFTDSDLQQQRQFIQQNMGLCDGPGTIANH
ncbi:MAG: HNH endonuclease family protein [Pseudobdellovibrionaceae bacterium]